MNSNSLSLIYQHYLEKTPFRKQNEHTYMMLPEAGNGNIYRVTTYSGIEIVYSHIQYHEPYPTNFASRGQMIELQFALSGQRYVNIAGLDYTLPIGRGALIFYRISRHVFILRLTNNTNPLRLAFLFRCLIMQLHSWRLIDR